MSSGQRKYQNQVAAGRVAPKLPTPFQQQQAEAAAQRREIDLLTPDDVARLLQVRVELLYKWRSQGIGPKGFRMGRYVRYYRSSVLQWLEAQETSGGR